MQIRKRKKKYQMKLGKGEELGFYESKNCCFEEGRLEAGVGVALYMEFLNKSLENFFKTHPIEKLLVGGEMLGDVYTPLVFILSGNGYVYVCGGESEEYFLESDLRFLDNAGLVLMTNEEGVYEVAVITDDGVYALQQDGFCATTYKGRTTNMGAFLHGRLYFSEEYAVHCTAPFSFVWETADGDNYGTVLVDKALGRVSSMIVCGEKLLVLQEYGAFFLEGGGAFRDFTVKHIERLGGRAVKGGFLLVY